MQDMVSKAAISSCGGVLESVCRVRRTTVPTVRR